MATFFKVDLVQVNKALLALAPTIRRKYAAHALKEGGKIVQNVAQVEAPVLARNKYRKGVLIRKPGTMRAAIKIRSSRDVNRTGDVGIFINVRPARGAHIGKYSPNDPFYWRWVHFGAKTVKRPVPFLIRSGRVLDTQALTAIRRDLEKVLPELNRQGSLF